MKNLLLLVLVSFSHALFADSFVVKNDGSKAVIKSNSFRLDIGEKKIYYKLLDDDSEIKMSFKDFEYVVYGVNKFKTFKFKNSNVFSGYFVIAETSEYSLISIVSQNLEYENSSKSSYIFHILNAKNEIIDTHEFTNLENSKESSIRSEIYSKIRFYFSTCTMLLNRLNYFDRNSQQLNNTSILNFFDKPVYVDCK